MRVTTLNIPNFKAYFAFCIVKLEWTLDYSKKQVSKSNI